MSPPNEFCLQGVIITSSWSGMASDCAGAAAVSEKLFDHGLLTSEGVGISFCSTADNDPLCEMFWELSLAHVPPSICSKT